ncbi:hypothetical protein RFI_40145 [Reticulomyxa filosa]|uniref:Uncharacterized protein n=1 Tax=Reticulomyxa filosa TaxID=46433 RepID=X6L7M9_RETFI|nr:hypothetical protein RFI_40145 [Reticulomyxa filosa]|eukprot:ETN97385.1 hypothetical protein RFI_40145 [Reticulomyxa filosa]
MEFAIGDCIVKSYLREWKQILPHRFSDDPKLLDYAVKKCVVDADKKTIGMKTVWKGKKPWWSASIHIKRAFRRNKSDHNYRTYKQAANELKKKLRHEKQEYLVKSVQSLQEGNNRQLFSQFKSVNK